MQVIRSLAGRVDRGVARVLPEWQVFLCGGGAGLAVFGHLRLRPLTQVGLVLSLVSGLWLWHLWAGDGAMTRAWARVQAEQRALEAAQAALEAERARFDTERARFVRTDRDTVLDLRREVASLTRRRDAALREVEQLREALERDGTAVLQAGTASGAADLSVAALDAREREIARREAALAAREAALAGREAKVAAQANALSVLRSVVADLRAVVARGQTGGTVATGSGEGLFRTSAPSQPQVLASGIDTATLSAGASAAEARPNASPLALSAGGAFGAGLSNRAGRLDDSGRRTAAATPPPNPGLGRRGDTRPTRHATAGIPGATMRIASLSSTGTTRTDALAAPVADTPTTGGRTLTTGDAGGANARPVAPRRPVYLQVAVFRSERRGENLRASLAAEGFDAAVLPTKMRGTPAVRVRVGPIDGATEREAALRQLRRFGIDDAYMVSF